jgi:outer membrane protein OmpA-like peptidoglycan-associated protein
MKAKILILALLVTLGSCKTWNKSEKGAAIGGAAGAATGAVIGKQSGNTIVGAIIGAAVGGTAGALIGNYMDKQAEEMQRDLEGATVERVGEGIKITFDSGLLFDINSSTLTATSQENLSKLSDILKKYDDTEILIEGHTDNTGTDEHNQKLSERRSESVSSYLKQNNVNGSRISSVGYGEKQPVTDNVDESGRSKNRRVDVAIFANKKLKRAAEKGEIGSLSNN